MMEENYNNTEGYDGKNKENRRNVRWKKARNEQMNARKCVCDRVTLKYCRFADAF